MARDESVLLKMVDNPESKHNVMAFFASQGGACAHYRLLQPAAHLKKYKDISYHACNSFNMAYPNPEVPLFQNGLDPFYDKYDTFIYQREARMPVFEFMMIAKGTKGIRQIYEIDDSFEGIPTESPSYDIIMKALPLSRYFWHHADDITCTTEPLAQELRRYNKNVHIIPNSIDFNLFDPFSKQNYEPDTIVIGWAGSIYHYSDIAIIEEVVTDIVNKYKNIKFFYGGNSQKKNDKTAEFFKDMPLGKRIIHPYVTINNYPEMISKVDIAICPLADNQLNRSKSNLKYLEFSALGIPVIASDIYPYSSTIMHNTNGVIVKNTYDEWYQALEVLIVSAKMRKAIGTEGRKNVFERYNQVDTVKYWHKLLTGSYK